LPGWVISMRTRVKEYRARYDLTQEELARKVGVRRETIVYMEAGKYIPSLKLAHDVAVALKATVDELFLFDD
jgi:putative transcriptional regulator